MQHTFFSHADGEALLQSAVAALIALVFVDATTALKAASVDVLLAHGPPEEAFTTITRLCTVVLPSRPVVADGTHGPRPAAVRRRTGETDGSSGVNGVQPLRVMAAGRYDCRHLCEMMR